jgi:uncharacterized integral membrane protein
MSITRATRVVLTLDLVFSLAAGLTLYALSTRTADYFAWTIKLPLTAALLGAGYLGAVATLVPTYFTREWQRVRLLSVMGFTLTFATLVVTLWHLDEFHLGQGATTARVAGWAWLVVYVAIPVLLAVVFVTQERAGGRYEYAVTEPLLPLTRAAMVVQAAVTGTLGAGLVLAPEAFDVVWPWPLPPLAAGAVGAWLLTIAAGSCWILRDGDWVRLRRTVPGLALFPALIVIAGIRYPEPLDGSDWQEWVFFGSLAGTLAACVATSWQQERRRRVPARAAVRMHVG